MVTISGVAAKGEKGFVLTGIREIVSEQVVLAGATDRFEDLIPALGVYYELLSLFIYANQTPSAAPDFYISQLIEANWRDGKHLAFDVGDGTDTYELDVTTKKFIAYSTKYVDQRFEIELPAHAVNDTTFYIRGVLAEYRMPS